MKKFLLSSFVLLFALVSSEVWAQERTVSGRVTSVEDGSTLPGVNVVLKGTTTGTVTDANGGYTLSVPSSGGTLVFTFIGLISQEQEIGARSTIDVEMVSDVTQLSEVVVTGYGVEQKRDLVGSIASIKGTAIENLPVQSFDRAIQGRAAGVQVQSTSGAPGGALTVRVRGPGSLANNSPLYIIDGVQVQSGGFAQGGSSNALAGINPNDIESIEILKDAAASAIYGAQSANGVVIITTKRGKKGKSNIDVNYQRGWVEPLPLYDVMNAQQFAEIREEAYVNAGLNPAAAWAQYGNPADPSTFTPEHWPTQLFRTGDIHSVNASASGGDDKTTFYISGAYESQEGQIVMSDWSRANLRTNFEHKASDKLSFRSNFTLARQNTFGSIADGNFVNGPFQSAFVSQPNSQAINPETGEFNPYPSHLPLTGAGHNFNYNILQGVNLERRESTAVQSIGNLQVTYEFIKGLTGVVFGGIDFIDNRYTNERPATIPAFAGNGGSTTVVDTRTLNWNVFGTLNYNRKFGDNHTVSAIVGYEFKERTQDQVTATGTGFAFPELRTLNNAAVKLNAAGFYTEFKRVGGFFRGNYDYANKYYVNATIRRDGHSRFGASNKFGNFWSVGAGWRLMEEGFMQGIGLLSDLKLRGSVGELGNAEGIGDFASRALYGGGGQYLGNPGTRPTAIANDLLSWERQKSVNIGLDFALFENRLYGAIDFWRTNTGDQLLNIPLPTDSGFGGVQGNAGNVLNEGIDLELGAVIIDKGGFTYRSSFNISFLRNEITDLGGEDRIGNTYIVGEPIGFFWGVPYAGVNPANGKAMWLDTLGNPSYNAVARDGRIIGQSLPKQFGGWSNTFSYKGLSLELFFQYQLGNDAFLGDMYNLAYSGSSRDNQLVSQLDRWRQPGDITNVPRPVEGGITDGYDSRFPGLAPSRFLADASYIRLKQITLAYDLPRALTERLNMRRVNVFVQAMNLLTWTSFPGIDPEVVNANNDVGVSTYGNYPNGRQTTLGINIGL